MEVSRLFLSKWSLPCREIWGSRRRERKRRLENDTDVQDRRELWVLGKQKQEEGEEEYWMTMTETDRNKMPVTERERESMTRDFPERKVFFYNLLHVCTYLGRQQLRWCSGSPSDC